MRFTTVVLILLLIAVQYPLWWGHGGWLRVHELQQQLLAEQNKNSDLKLRNDRLSGEVDDLEHGTAAIEERARYELGMIKDDEVFVQFVSPDLTPNIQPGGAAVNSVTTRGTMSAAPARVVPEPAPRAPRVRKSARSGSGSAHHQTGP
ncbi:MAG: cell division protein FtsB [Janthinobacterium lividum]